MKSQFQIFVENLVLSILTLIKVLLLSSCFTTPKAKKTNKSCVILGNSPSLKETIEKNKNFIEDKDLFAVNFFWKSELFTEVTPENYVIVSTNYWSKGKIDQNDEGRKATFNEIARKTTWKMNLFVPVVAKKHTEWKSELIKNSNISIHYFNVTPVEGYRWFSHCLFNHFLGMPRPHNVIIPSLLFAINMKYESVYIFGAEHSWMKDIYVADDNKVYLTQKHFYDSKIPKAEVMYHGTSNEERTLGEMLMKFVYTFNSYFILNDYAKSKGVKIFNATKDSYIDAFERYTLPN
jgi:hypothetical protein